MGDKWNQRFQLSFNAAWKIQFQGLRVSSAAARSTCPSVEYGRNLSVPSRIQNSPARIKWARGETEMKLLFAVLVAISGGGLLTHGQTVQSKTHLKVGDVAPNFTLPSTQGGEFTLSDYLGKKSVVLAFFPKAYSGGCTKEMTAYQSGISDFNSAEAQVVAISTDNLDTLKRWSRELKASFPFLSDAGRKVSALYGVLSGSQSYANRTTFIIDTEGRIQHIEEGSAALDPSGAATACKRMAKR
jgi:peroxiredoxin